MNEWIPVSERLPEDGEDVLASDGFSAYVAFHMMCGWASFDTRFNPKNIIAWMPLPEPYKEEQEHEQADKEET